MMAVMQSTQVRTSARDPMTTGRFVSQLLVRVPEACDVVEEHLDDMERVVLLHLLMADLLRFAVANFHASRTDVTVRLLLHIDHALTEGDEYVRNAVDVSFVEHVGGSPGETSEVTASWPAGLLAERDQQLARQHSDDFPVPGPQAALNLVGDVVWLTAEQGGRRWGPPSTTGGVQYRCTAFVVPPLARQRVGRLRFGSRRTGAVLSRARGGWLLPDALDVQHGVPSGSIVVLTEGRRRVAYFNVEAALMHRAP